MPEILLVDDESWMRSLMLDALQKQGIETETIIEACGATLVPPVLEQNPKVSVVVTDHSMPLGNGNEVIKFIAERRSENPDDQRRTTVVWQSDSMHGIEKALTAELVKAIVAATREGVIDLYILEKPLNLEKEWAPFIAALHAARQGENKSEKDPTDRFANLVRLSPTDFDIVGEVNDQVVTKLRQNLYFERVKQ